MAKKRVLEPDNIFVSSDEKYRIELQAIDLIFLQTVINSIDIPEPPTYEARTASGRVEVHEMDKESAKQTPGGEELWNTYIRKRNTALNIQTERSTRYIILDGTKRNEALIDGSWFRRMKIIKIPVPTDDDELWVTFLVTTLSQLDIVRMSNKILSLSGLSPEVQKMIEAAEDSFRDQVRADDEREGLVDPEPDTEGVAEGGLAT